MNRCCGECAIDGAARRIYQKIPIQSMGAFVEGGEMEKMQMNRQNAQKRLGRAESFLKKLQMDSAKQTGMWYTVFNQRALPVGNPYPPLWGERS